MIIHYLIKSYEADKRKQHPVGMTFSMVVTNIAVVMPTYLIAQRIGSPNPEGGYQDNPQVNNGSKVILNDTDHLWGEGGNPQWVWRS